MPTLLESFIDQKLREYEEPSRHGTARGERIGYSRVKFHAVLLALTTDTVNEQAELLGVAYPVLRKWRSESEFKEAVARTVEEFVAVFFASLDEHHGSTDERFSDLDRYCDALLSAITSKSYSREGTHQFYAARRLLQKFAGKNKSWEGFDKLKGRLSAEDCTKMALQHLNFIHEVLSKSAPTHDERRNAKLLTEAVKRLIG